MSTVDVTVPVPDNGEVGLTKTETGSPVTTAMIHDRPSSAHNGQGRPASGLNGKGRPVSAHSGQGKQASAHSDHGRPVSANGVVDKSCEAPFMIPHVPDQPPDIRLPCCPRPYKGIDIKPLCPDRAEVITDTEKCKQLVARFQKEKVIAFGVQGIHVGKEGPVTLMQIGTCSGHVFVFDILENRDLVHRGRLKYVLQDPNITKVIHDCSSVNAAMEFQFATTLNNVFDTHVAHLIIEKHKGRRLPSGVKLSELVLQYAEKPDKFLSYDWRADSKNTWMSICGNFWAMRPLTTDMVEFAACDVVVLIPEVYHTQSEYIDKHRLRPLLKQEVNKWLAIDFDMVIREKHGQQVWRDVDDILHDMDSKYDDRATVINILEPDEVNALALTTYEDAMRVSERIRQLKTACVLRELDSMELAMRTDDESWQHARGNVLEILRYYQTLPDTQISKTAANMLQSITNAILEHIEGKYNIDTMPNMLTLCERDSILTLTYKDVAAGHATRVVTEIYWRLMQEEIHGMINFLRFSPTQFQLTEEEYTKVVHFAEDVTGLIPEEIASLAAGLVHALRAYNAANGSYTVDERRRIGSS